MHHEIVISGFGGQGVILAGKMLIHACMLEDRYVSHIPSYGIEMRGGSANCALVVSDKKIGSPLVKQPSSAVLLSRLAFQKYEPEVAPGGVLIANTSLITEQSKRDDIRVVSLPCDDIADQNGQPRSVNVAALGGLVGALGVCQPESLRKAFELAFKRKGKAAVDVNMRVLDSAIEYVKKQN